MFGEQFVVTLKREDDTLTREDMTPAEVEDVLTSAMAMSGKSFAAGIAFCTGIKDEVSYTYRAGGPEDWFGPKRTLTVKRVQS